MPWVYGCNMPGYMPDEPYSEAATWDEARDALLFDVERADEGAWNASVDELDAAERKLRCADPGEAFVIRCGAYVLCAEQVA